MNDLMHPLLHIPGYETASEPEPDKIAAVGICRLCQSSASECVLISMLVARHAALNELKLNTAAVEEGVLLSRLVAYCSKLVDLLYIHACQYLIPITVHIGRACRGACHSLTVNVVAFLRATAYML